MANTKIVALEAVVTEAADMAVRAKPGYGQSCWVEARASLQVLTDKVARNWAALQGRTVDRAEMHAQAVVLIRKELATRAANLRDYRAAAEAARVAAAFAPARKVVTRKAIPQAAANVATARKATPVAALKAIPQAAAKVRVARPAMDLEALVAAGFARQAATAAKKAGAVPSEVKAVRKAAKKVAKGAAKAAKAAKKEAQAAFKAAAATKAAAKTKGRKA